MKEIATALNKFQMQMGGLEKNAKGNRGSYADIGEVINTAKEATKFGLSWWQGVTQADGSQVLRTIIFHTSGEQLPPSDWPLAVDDWTNAQKVGSASTYARRYGLNAALGLAVGVTDDDGAVNGDIKDPPKKTPARPDLTALHKSDEAIVAGQAASQSVPSPDASEAAASIKPTLKKLSDAGTVKTPAEEYLEKLQAKIKAAGSYDEVVEITTEAVNAAKTLDGVEQMFRFLQPSSEQIIKIFASKKRELVQQLAKEQSA
jgi:hypothetical protein